MRERVGDIGGGGLYMCGGVGLECITNGAAWWWSRRISGYWHLLQPLIQPLLLPPVLLHPLRPPPQPHPIPQIFLRPPPQPHPIPKSFSALFPSPTLYPTPAYPLPPLPPILLPTSSDRRRQDSCKYFRLLPPRDLRLSRTREHRYPTLISIRTIVPLLDYGDIWNAFDCESPKEHCAWSLACQAGQCLPPEKKNEEIQINQSACR